MVKEFIRRCKEIASLVNPDTDEIIEISVGLEITCFGLVDVEFPLEYFGLSNEEIIEAEAKRQKQDAEFYAAWIETTKRQQRETDEKEFKRLKEKLGL